MLVAPVIPCYPSKRELQNQQHLWLCRRHGCLDRHVNICMVVQGPVGMAHRNDHNCVYVLRADGNPSQACAWWCYYMVVLVASQRPAGPFSHCASRTRRESILHFAHLEAPLRTISCKIPINREIVFVNLYGSKDSCGCVLTGGRVHQSLCRARLCLEPTPSPL